VSGGSREYISTQRDKEKSLPFGTLLPQPIPPPNHPFPMRIILFLVIVLSVSCSQREKKEVYQPLAYSIYFGETKAGFYEAAQKEDGTYSFVMEFNDRGRGPHLEELIRLADNGSIESLQIQGHNY
jgi:hypothetical protein